MFYLFFFGVFIDLCVDVAVDIYFVSRMRMGFRVEKQKTQQKKSNMANIIQQAWTLNIFLRFLVLLGLMVVFW